MRYLRIKNWAEFQHYRDRLPPWIKLHRALLTDYDFLKLPDEVKGQLMMIWLLASQTDGRIPDDPEFVGERIGAKRPVKLATLISGGWLVVEQVASTPIATCGQSAVVETEAYKASEAEPETDGAPGKPEIPPWVPPGAWKDWLDFRKARKGWTYRAETLCLRELTKLYEAGHDPTAVIEQSIMRGWTGLFPISERRASAGRSPTLAERRVNTVDGIIDAGARPHERAIPGIAERVDREAVPALSVALRE